MRGEAFTTRMAAGIVLAAAAATVPAAELTVRVSKQGTGSALQSAAVCVGTPANPSQFGAFTTGAGGAARFRRLPASPLVVIVSKAGFRGRRVALDPTTAPRAILVPLPSGGGGPSCARATSPSGESLASAGLAIREFRLNGGDAVTSERDVTFDYALRGAATHYRVAEKPQLDDLPWSAVQAPIRYRLSAGDGPKTVYFQVRSYRSVDGGEIETVSAIASDSITLVP